MAQSTVSEVPEASHANSSGESPTRPAKLAIFATKGTLDWAYPPSMIFV